MKNGLHTYKKKAASAIASVALAGAMFAPLTVFGEPVFFRYSPPPSPGSGAYGFSRSLATTLSASCAPMQNVAQIGEEMLWFSSVQGGAGAYQYFWSGSDGLTGNSSTARKTYTTAGEKFATVTVASGAQSVTVGCARPLAVQPSFAVPSALPQTPHITFGFSASCFAAPDRIEPGGSATWLARVGAAADPISYEWFGTDGLSGDKPAAFMTYEKEGLKHAVLTVISGDKRETVNCTNAVTVAAKPAPVKTAARGAAPQSCPSCPEGRSENLLVMCSADRQEAGIGEKVHWSAIAAGGTGTYAYLWHGDGGLSGDARTATTSYEERGKKNARVVVRSGTESVIKECDGSVAIERNLAGGIVAAIGALPFLDTAFLAFLALLAILLGVFLAVRKSAEKRKEENQ